MIMKKIVSWYDVHKNTVNTTYFYEYITTESWFPLTGGRNASRELDCHGIREIHKGFKHICEFYLKIWSRYGNTDLFRLSNKCKICCSSKFSLCLKYFIILKVKVKCKLESFIKMTSNVDYFHKSIGVSCSPTWMSTIEKGIFTYCCYLLTPFLQH